MPVLDSDRSAVQVVGTAQADPDIWVLAKPNDRPALFAAAPADVDLAVILGLHSLIEPCVPQVFVVSGHLDGYVGDGPPSPAVRARMIALARSLTCNLVKMLET